MTRVVITGFAMITAFGKTNETWRKIIQGESSLKEDQKIKGFNTRLSSRVDPSILEEYRFNKNFNKLDPNHRLMLACAKDSLDMAGLLYDNSYSDRTGIVIGSLNLSNATNKEIFSIYNSGEFRKMSPAYALQSTPNALSGQLAIEYGLKGPNITISTACSSGAHAISIGVDTIRLGKADCMVVGGTDHATPTQILKVYDNLRVMTPDKARPFSSGRNGFNLGEAAGIMILENYENAIKRGAKIFGEILGTGVTCDAYSMAIPDESGGMIARTMELALNDAGISSYEVDYINAHATGTKMGDYAETQAIKKVFGSHAYDLKISSVKGAIGHTIGAAGAVEAIITLLTIKNNKIPPTINMIDRDPGCDLDYCFNEMVNKEVNTAISNSFGFGGNNVSIVLKGV